MAGVALVPRVLERSHALGYESWEDAVTTLGVGVDGARAAVGEAPRRPETIRGRQR